MCESNVSAFEALAALTTTSPASPLCSALEDPICPLDKLPVWQAVPSAAGSAKHEEQRSGPQRRLACQGPQPWVKGCF